MVAGLRGRLLSRSARPLTRSAASTVAAALDLDPVGSCMVGARFEAGGMDRERVGGLFFSAGSALCFAGANLIPLAGEPASLRELAPVFRGSRRQCASLMGRADYVLPLWQALRPDWGPAREERPDQPLLICADPPAVRADPQVVTVTANLLDTYYPAAVAMFTEEVGVDPRLGDGGVSYRHRVAELIRGRRAFAIFDGDRVIYKAEVGSLSRRVGLIQGVWVDPAWRGRGLAAPATAAVVAAVQGWGRIPSLYVNAHNAAARATYRRIGFHQVGTFATVLL